MNDSGIRPKGFSVLVKLDAVEEQQGILALPPDIVLARQYAQTKCTMIEAGPLAWVDEIVDGVVMSRCMPGDKVLIKKFAGEQIDVGGGILYRLVNDKDIFATRDK